MEAGSRTNELVNRAKAGDEAAFQLLVERYQPHLERVIRSRLGSGLERQIDAADVAQESFLRAFQALSSFSWSDDASLLKWLIRIATNYVREVARREKRRLIVPLHDEVPARGVTQSRAQRREERFGRLMDALDRLDPAHREVVQLARIERLPIREIATRMGRTASATSQLLWRAMQKLKKEFGDTESFHLPDRKLGHPGERDVE